MENKIHHCLIVFHVKDLMSRCIPSFTAGAGRLAGGREGKDGKKEEDE